MKEKIKQFIVRRFKARFSTVYVFLPFLLLGSRPDDGSFRLGAWVILAGLGLRFWAGGCVVKFNKLATGGPYAFVRNPLYLGTLIMTAGFVIMTKAYVVGVLALIVLFLVYDRTMKDEELGLASRHDEEYRLYRQSVPGWIPRLTPYKGGSSDDLSFSFQRIVFNREYKVVIWAIFLVIGLYLYQELVLERGAFDLKAIFLAGLALVLVLVDIITELAIRYQKSRSKSNPKSPLLV